MFKCKELMKSNNKICSFNELEYIKYDNESNFNSDTLICESDMFVSFPDKLFKKKISINGIEYSKNELKFISKPILYKEKFDNWNEKVIMKHFLLNRNEIIEEKILPLFLFEFIYLKKIDKFSTNFTLIEIFPSIDNLKDKFNILKKHEGRKSRIKTMMENTQTNSFNDIDKNDPLGKLLFNSINKN
jgi:hypothetical protein